MNRNRKVLKLIDAIIESRVNNDFEIIDDFEDASQVAEFYEETLNNVEYFLIQAFLSADYALNVLHKYAYVDIMMYKQLHC